MLPLMSIEDLERDCHKYLSLGPGERGSHVVPSLHALIENYLTEAVKPAATSSNRGPMLLLERAEAWCEALESILRGGRTTRNSPIDPKTTSERLSPMSGRVSPTGGLLSVSPTSPGGTGSLLMRVQAAILKERTYSLVRDVATSTEQWPVAIRYAKRAHKLTEGIRSVVNSVAHRDTQSDVLRSYNSVEGAAGDTDLLEFQRLVPLFEAQRSAKNLMNLCVLVSKVKRHHDAAQYAMDSVHILRPLLEASSGKRLPHIASSSSSRLADDGTRDDAAVEQSPGGLLAAALFNLGSQLELCQRGREAMAAFDEALDLADAHLGKRHPLSKQLRHIVFRTSIGAGDADNGLDGGAALPSVPCSMTQAHFVASAGRAAPSSGRGGSSTHRPQHGVGGSAVHRLAAQPPRSASTGGGGDAFRRRISTAPSSQDGPTARPPLTGRPPMADGPIGVSRPTSRPGTQRLPTQLQPLRSQSSPSKGPGPAWEDPSLQTEELRHRKGVDPPVAVLDLSEVLKEQQQRERYTPTVERLSSDAVQAQHLGAGTALASRTSSRPSPSALIAPTVKARQALHHSDGGAASGTESLAASSPAPGSAASHRPRTNKGGGSTTTTKRVRGTASGSTGGDAGSVSNLPVDPVAVAHQKLQQWFASVTERQWNAYHNRFQAAQRIQQAWRCSRARLERFNRQQIYYHFLYEEQRAAVACIAAAFQAFMDRRRLVQQRQHNRLVREQAAMLEARRQAAAKTLGRAIRGFLCYVRKKRELMRKLRLKQEGKLVLYETASMVVQRWWRIVRVRKAYWRRRNAEVAEEKRQLQLAQRRDRAATTIQRRVRGIQGRAFAVAYRKDKVLQQKELQRRLAESTDCVRIFMQEIRHRLHRVSLIPAAQERQRQVAVARIKEGWTEALQRRAMKHRSQRSRLVLAAVKVIQRCYRCHRARRDLRVLRTIARTTTSCRISDEFRQSRAAVRIQCLARTWLATRRARTVKASFGRRIFNATSMLQRCARGLTLRCRLGAEWNVSRLLAADALAHAVATRHNTIALVQAAARSFLSRRLRFARLDAEEREALLIARRTRREMVEDTAASKIQSLARMRNGQQVAAQERQLLDARKAATLRAIVRLQCFFRTCAARQTLTARRVQMQRRRAALETAALVAHELFLMHVLELDSLATVERRHIETLEDAAWAALVPPAVAHRDAEPPVSRGAGQSQQPAVDAPPPSLPPPPSTHRQLQYVGCSEDDDDDGAGSGGVYDEH